jgi:YD repeat-containing protein
MGGGEGEAAGAAVEAGAGVSAAAAPAGHRCRLDGGPPAGHHAPAGHPWRLDRDASDGVKQERWPVCHHGKASLVVTGRSRPQ